MLLRTARFRLCHFHGNCFRMLITRNLYDHPSFKVDLSAIYYRLQSANCTVSDATLLIYEYRRFLFLMSITEDESKLIPSKRVEEVWQCHILHSKLYRLHCQSIFGRFVHYKPISSNDAFPNRRVLYQETLKLYQDTFKEDPYDQIWPSSYHSVLDIVRLNYHRTVPSFDFSRKLFLSPNLKLFETIYLRLVNVHKWGTILSENRLIEYLKFLQLANLSSNRIGVVPSKHIDIVWHEHILHTSFYEAYCKDHFGTVIDHNPGSESVNYSKAYNYTLHRYKEVFGNVPPKKHWPRQATEPQDDDMLWQSHHYYNTSHSATSHQDQFADAITKSDQTVATPPHDVEQQHSHDTHQNHLNSGTINMSTKDKAMLPPDFQTETFAKDSLFVEEEFKVTEFKDDFSFFSSDGGGDCGGGGCGGGGCGGD